jgi:hypothetical protein
VAGGAVAGGAGAGGPVAGGPVAGGANGAHPAADDAGSGPAPVPPTAEGGAGSAGD